MAHRPTARDGHCRLSALTQRSSMTRISAPFAAFAVLALVGCAGGKQLAPLSIPNTPLGRSADRAASAASFARAIPSSLSGEVLTATNVVVTRARHCQPRTASMHRSRRAGRQPGLIQARFRLRGPGIGFSTILSFGVLKSRSRSHRLRTLFKAWPRLWDHSGRRRR